MEVNMSTDFEVDAIGGIDMKADWEKWFDSKNESVKPASKDFQTRIFSPPSLSDHFEGKEFNYLGHHPMKFSGLIRL